MSRTQHVLAFITLFVGLAHSFSWDIVVGARNKLEFYNDSALVHTEDLGEELEIEQLVYDIAHNRLLLFDTNPSGATSIYSFNIATKEILSLVKKNPHESFRESILYSLAYDPVTESVFWNAGNKIYWFSLKPGFDNNIYGNDLLKVDDYLPSGLAVDSCNGHIYLSYGVNTGPSTIEKARLDGSRRKIVLRDNTHFIQNLVIDQQTKRMYWTRDKIPPQSEAKQFSIHSADLNGHNRTRLYIEREKYQPKKLTVSKDSIYWSHSVALSNKIWHLPKNPSEDTIPDVISVLGGMHPPCSSFAVNYKIEDQLQGIEGCKPLRSLLPKDKVTNE